MKTRQEHPSLRPPIGEDRGGLLRPVLKLDAVASGALGALSLAAAPVLEGMLGTPVTLLVPVGLFLVPWAVALWVVATRPRISSRVVWAVILLNSVWAVDSALVVAAGWFSLTAVGIAFVLAQAAAVALFTAAQFYALRRMG